MNAAASQGLNVEGLVKEFSGVRAVNGISFTAGPGEFISLLGPSGCGKTTTLRCIAGFEHPQSGRITLNGMPLTDADKGIFTPPHQRRFGMVFQSYAVWPHMTVFDNVAYPLKVQGGVTRAAIGERVRAKLDMVGLGGLEQRYPSHLSGGQQQRVALARAIVMEPQALLFDEPLSNLDAKLRERMRFELIELQRQLGIPAVYVTHDQTEAMVMSDRILVMEKGIIAQEGGPENIYARPANAFVADFIGLCNFIEADIVAAAGDGRWQVRSPLGTHLCVGDMPLTAGDHVTLMIRPERITLAGAPAADGITAEIRRRYFLGAQTEYQLAVGETTLRAQVSDPAIHAIGSKVALRITPDDCRVVRRGNG
jgi:iron(III) transport system ATP-binding protein